jgi:hypothetical protein
MEVISMTKKELSGGDYATFEFDTTSLLLTLTTKDPLDVASDASLVWKRSYIGLPGDNKAAIHADHSRGSKGTLAGSKLWLGYNKANKALAFIVGPLGIDHTN